VSSQTPTITQEMRIELNRTYGRSIIAPITQEMRDWEHQMLVYARSIGVEDGGELNAHQRHLIHLEFNRTYGRSIIAPVSTPQPDDSTPERDAMDDVLSELQLNTEEIYTSQERYGISQTEYDNLSTFVRRSNNLTFEYEPIPDYIQRITNDTALQGITPAIGIRMANIMESIRTVPRTGNHYFLNNGDGGNYWFSNRLPTEEAIQNEVYDSEEDEPLHSQEEQQEIDDFINSVNQEFFPNQLGIQRVVRPNGQ